MGLTKGFVLGAATAYLLDPTLGRTRRKRLSAQTARLARRAARLAGRKSSYAMGRVRGAAASVTPDTHERPTDDATVLQRIRSEALRDVGLSAADVEVRVENGVATLEGTVASAKLAEDLLARVRGVPGVQDVALALRVGGPSEGDD
jgi:osmotically-inducible protein OsmY